MSEVYSILINVDSQGDIYFNDKLIGTHRMNGYKDYQAYDDVREVLDDFFFTLISKTLKDRGDIHDS